jgi:4-amino-4-deoxy-L-arabinose transferase-like glycosyltransferase
VVDLKIILRRSIIFSIFILCLFLRIFFLHPTFSDENFYFNVAKNIIEGKIPYNDFFFAHPPLQVYTLALLFRIFGTFFLIGKILTLVTSSLCIFLIFFISRELFDEKTGLITSLIFLLTPAFLAFSTMGHGMWETTFLFLLSTYLLIKNRPTLAGFIFSFAILFRYLVIIYLPFLIILLYLRKQKIKKFIISFVSITFISGFVLLSIFGRNYINQTIFYHIFSKTFTTTETQGLQYWGIGYFFFFLSLISAFIGYTKNDRIVLLFAIIPLITDLTILFGLRLVFYHYFFISLAFCILATGRTFTSSNDILIKIAILIILLSSIIFNLNTIDFYLNSRYSEKFYYIAEFVTNNTSVNDVIFGEPVITNYVSFTTGRNIASNYLDSYLQHLKFEDEEKVVEKLEENKPKIFIEMKGYYFSTSLKGFIQENYVLEKEIKGIPNYFLYRIKCVVLN